MRDNGDILTYRRSHTDKGVGLIIGLETSRAKWTNRNLMGVMNRTLIQVFPLITYDYYTKSVTNSRRVV